MFGRKRALDIYQALHSYRRVSVRDIIPALYTDITLWKDLADFVPSVQTPAGHTLAIDSEPHDYDHSEDIKTPRIKTTCIAGTARFDHAPVAIIAQQMPPSDQERGAYNYGLATADDYIIAITMMRYAAAHDLPLHTYIDTVGGDPFTPSAKKLQSWLISECIAEMISLPVPTISVIVGQGGSGGALALHPADYRLMLDGRKNGAFFSVIDPKGCAAILFRSDTNESVMDAIEILQPTADYMIRYGIINGIIPELSLDDRDYLQKTIFNIQYALQDATDELALLDRSARDERRKEEIVRIGHITPEQSRYTGFRRLILRQRTTRSRRTERAVDPYIAQIRIHAHRQHGAKGDDDVLAHIVPRVCDDERDKEDPKTVLRCGCRKYIEDGSFEQNFFSCPHCARPDTIDANYCIGMLFDHSYSDSSFTELHSELTIEDIDGWKHLYDYGKQRKRAEQRASAKEALVIGYGKIHGLEVAAAIHHFPYMGGAFDAVCGEKFRIIADVAIEKKIPLITYTATGGMSMWNGTVSLWQMVKTIFSLGEMKKAGLPTISILGHPTTGGSFVTAVQSDILIGERHAEARFAGRRVVTLSSGGKDIDIAATTMDFFQDNGLLHMVLERRQMRSALFCILRQWYQQRPPVIHTDI